MILFRSTLTELARPFMLTMGVMSLLVLMGKVQRMVMWMVDKRLGLDEILLIFFYLLPSTLALTVPFAVLGAVFMVVIRQSLDSELTAQQASGVSFWRYATPFMAFGLLVTGLAFGLSLWLQPWFSGKFRDLQIQIIKNHAEGSITPREFNFDFGDTAIRIQNHGATGEFHGVFMAPRTQDPDTSVVLAKSGRIQVDEGYKQVVFRLSQGIMYAPDQDFAGLTTTRFQTLDYVLTLPSARSITTQDVELIWTLPTTDLRQRILTDLPVEPFVARSMIFEYWNRWTVPWVCLGFAIAAITLAMVDPRSGRGAGFLKAIGLVAGYYLLWILTKNMIMAGQWPGEGLFLPPLMVLAFGLYKIARVSAYR